MGDERSVRLSTQIIEALADEKGCDPLDLKPLYTTVDLDALDAFATSADSDWKIEFTVDDTRVTVHSNRTVDIKNSALSTNERTT